MRTDILEQARTLKAKIDKNQKIVDTVEAAGGHHRVAGAERQAGL